MNIPVIMQDFARTYQQYENDYWTAHRHQPEEKLNYRWHSRYESNDGELCIQGFVTWLVDRMNEQENGDGQA